MAKNTWTLEDKYCRTCLQEFNGNEPVSESLKHFISPEIADKLLSYTMIRIDTNDEFPKHLCECCYNQLNKFDAFRSMCHASLLQFRKMLLLAATSLEEVKDEEHPIPMKSSILEAAETEIPVSLAQEINPTQNPLEIHVRRLRKRKGILSKAKCAKRTRTSLKIVQHASPKCDERLNSNFTNTSKSGDENFSRSKTRSQRKSRQQTNKESRRKSSKVFQCEACSMRFFVEHRFNAHQRSHDGLIPYPCPHKDCERGFERFQSLSQHLKQHEGTNRLFACVEPDCNRRYKHKTTLDLHLRRYHKKGPELKSFVCEICGKVFKSSAILNDHRFTHKDKSELPFACQHPQCKYRFSNSSKLKLHMMRHAGIKKFVCPVCGMRKTTKNELSIHINYHTLERRFPCRFCPQVCNNSGNLKVHVRTVHERAKDYACRFCDRTFAKPDTRKYHEMIHTGEKPHVCTDCGKRFVQPAALRTHMKIHLRQKTEYKTPAVDNANSEDTSTGSPTIIKSSANEQCL